MPEQTTQNTPYIKFNGTTVSVAQGRAFIGGAFNSTERAELLNNSLATDFNTYKNWQDFDLFLQGGKYENEDFAITAKGRRSLFNSFSGITKMGITQNIPLLDDPTLGNAKGSFSSAKASTRRMNTDCTVKSLVESSQAGDMGIAYYSYADFMYCRDLGKLPNNHLITLRRFAYPCSDEILSTPNTPGLAEHHSADIGRLIGWFGNEENKLDDILKYSFGMNWKELKAEIQQINGNADNSSQGILGKVMNTFMNDSYAKGAMQGTTETHNLFGKYSKGGPYSGAEWLTQYDSNKVYGPLNVIDQTTIRDTGLKFEHSITLTFNYELRSYNGINPRAALLDLLANILTVCGNTGRFWGGSVNFIGPTGANGFQNLAIYNAKNPEEFIQGLQTDISKGLSKMMDMFKNPKNALSGAKNMLNNALSILAGGALNALGRPNMYAIKSLLSPSPTGMWHLTVGNPKNPILSCGNLIMENAEVQHYGALGFDDFPTGIKVTVTLKHGKPRDIASIEHMYTMGRDRIYTPMTSKIKNMYQAAPNGNKNEVSGNTDKGADTEPIAKPLTKINNNGKNNTKYLYETSIKAQRSTAKWFGTSNDDQIMPSSTEMM